LPHEFGVVVHFQESDPESNRFKLRQILQNIREIVAQEKPAHSLATVLSNVPS